MGCSWHVCLILKAAKLTVKLDGDIIMGDYIRDKRYQSEGMGSIEDIRYTVLKSWAFSANNQCCAENVTDSGISWYFFV